VSNISIDQALAMAGHHLLAGDVAAANGLANEIVSFAVSLISQGRIGDCEDVLGRLRSILPTNAAILLYLGTCRQLRGDHRAAEALIRRALILAPDRADGWSNLGVSLLALGDVDQAVDCFRRAVRRDGSNRHALNNLGAALLKRQDWDNARTVLERLVGVAPDNVAGRVNLAMALTRLGETGRAAVLCEDVLAAGPDNVDALVGLADVCKARGQGSRAIELLRLAVANGGDSQVANTLANTLQAEGFLGEALEIYRSIAGQEPDNAEVLSNMGNALAALGRVDDAVEAYRTSLRLRPDFRVHSNLLFARQYEADATAGTLLAEARQWNRLHGGVERCMHPNEPDSERRLRIGYLSPDFRRHAAGYFLLPMVTAHDSQAVEVYCYHDHPQSDDVTDLIRQGVEHWRTVSDMGDGQLVGQIQADGIDILVDCAGHTAGGRLGALARKPAPIQITTMLGHGGTTGMTAMDHVMADAILVPDGAEAGFCEQVLRLPVFAPFRPDPAWPPPLPLADGPPLLACFGNPARIGEALIDLWARVLDRLPGSRLLLKHGNLADSQDSGHWRSRFARLGDRVLLEGLEGGWAANMGTYGRIAVALDTFPSHGATSTLIPLWMGVPVVSLAGSHSGQRFGASILGTAGLGDLVAGTPEEYVDKVVELAQNRSRLADLRGSLRNRLEAGPTCDARGFARSAESIFRSLWRHWCETRADEIQRSNFP
jgi:predicted O-linked N-acetylglucosamine transferase (SPINDLY family)